MASFPPSSSPHTEKEAETNTDVITPSNLSCQTGSDDHKFESDHEMRDGNDDIEACMGDVMGERDGLGVLGKILTRLSMKSAWKDPGPPPDGGWNAWVQGKVE